MDEHEPFEAVENVWQTLPMYGSMLWQNLPWFLCSLNGRGGRGGGSIVDVIDLPALLLK